MTDLQVPPRTEPTALPAPTMDLVGERVPVPPPPPLRVPAVSPPSLPPLSGAPVVPPLPRFSLDEVDAADSADEAAPAPDVAHALPEPDLSCPPIVEAARVMTLTDGDAAPFVVSPTTETPIVEAIPTPSPSEPLGQPAVAMGLPTLPSLAVPPPSTDQPDGPTSHHPTQVGVAPVTSMADALAAPAAKVEKSGRGFGKTVVRTGLAIVLSGAVGAGAHLGYDWWESRDATAVAGVSVDGTDLSTWPQIDPPAIRYTDSVTVFRTAEGVRTLTAHREIASGRTQATVESIDAVGADLGTVDIDFRGEESFIRNAPESPWAPTPSDIALAQIGDTWTADVFTVNELFPAAALPYITVLESVERVLPVRPLVTAADPNLPVATPIATSTDPTSMVWQYRVIIDVESFRTNETAAFNDWSRRLGRNAVSRIEAWVDTTGIVRQIAVEVDGTVVTHTLVGGSANSTRFDVNPLLAADPATAPADPAAPIAPAEAEG